MGLTVVKGLRSEIFVPRVPPPVWTPVTKPLSAMTIALVTAGGVHRRADARFTLAGDTSYREIPGDVNSADLMVSHGGYDNADVQRDINCMFPIDRLRELAEERIIGNIASTHFGLMGGGGDIRVFTDVTGPEIAQKLKDARVDAVLLTAG